ncbi:50S ribosomal protein L3 [Candidatus Pacearchaeota archaeon]|nr:50S ribosomal protein L3 [Candidatus Pacearchaeota archaeon]
MGKHATPRHGSLQFYPRSRAHKILPRVNWNFINRKDVGLLGFLGYKVGMMSAYVKDNTANSLTKGQRIIIPVTILECPPIKILSTRFYSNGKVAGEVLNHNLDKELKKKIKLPKQTNKKIEDFEKSKISQTQGSNKPFGFNKEFDDIRVVVYSQVKKTGIKKTPDIIEIGLSGNKEEKLNFIKNNLSKEISIKDVLKEGVVDIRGVTIGKGLQGTIKRFGLTLKGHKSEKGQRTLGSGGPWHPSRVDFTQPRAGQMGFFTRVVYNNKIVFVGDIKEKDINLTEGFKHFGKIKNDYIILRGSVQGPVKRQLILTSPLRPSKEQVKKNYEFIELR